MDPALVWMNLMETVFAVLVVGLLGVVLVGAFCIGCAALLSPRTGTAFQRSRYAVGLMWAALALAAGVSVANAQTESKKDVPQIEPRYTQVFASDTVDIMFPRPSPDGRWIVYSHATGAEATAGLRLLSVKGGEPIELTSGNLDVRTGWFPTSDRIVFQSNSVNGLMTMAIDPETGAATGPAKRLTLEDAFGPSPVSPDGQWIAYRVWATEGAELGMAIKVIPARGGNARTVLRLPRKPQLRFWSRDGRHLYFTWSDTPGARSKMWRVAVDGGDPEVLEEIPTGSSAPDLRYRLVRSETATSAGDVVNEIVRVPDRQTLATVSLPREMRGGQFTSDGRYLMTVIRNSVSPLRILPVAGGAMRQLGDARADDTPIGWTPDGERVIYQTRLDGRVAMMAVPVEGGAAEEYTIIPDLHRSSYRYPVIVSESGRYIAFTSSEDGGPETLKIARVSDGQVRQVTDSVASLELKGLDAPGGLPTVGDEFLYMERRGDRNELRITSFQGPSRLIRSFPQDLGTRTFWGVYEDRVAWTEAAGDSVAIVVADGPDDPVRRLALVDGLFDDLVWSPDGRWLAASFYKRGSDGPGFKILLIPMTADGEAASAPRYIDTQIGVGYGIRWLPDSQALTIFAQTLPHYGTDVWLFSIREGEQPVAITRDEDSEFWYYQLSPDGRYIAYQGEIQRGSSLWMIDLGDALASNGN